MLYNLIPTSNLRRLHPEKLIVCCQISRDMTHSPLAYLESQKVPNLLNRPMKLLMDYIWVRYDKFNEF